MPSPARLVRSRSALSRWFLETEPPEQEPEGFYESEQAAQVRHHSHPWWQVMCLTGVDYFSSLGYAPGIAFLAAGALSPVATLVLVLVTLFCALPMYRQVAAESPHGDGSLSMLERLLTYWPSKLLVLALLGFVATGFVITITLSAADAAAHLIENPFLKNALSGQQVTVTLVLIALLGAVFLKGFKEAVGIAVALVVLYLGLNVVLIVRGLVEVATHASLVGDWWTGLRQSYFSPLALIGAAVLVFPRLALGMSGFETGVLVMPLVRGKPGDTPERPLGRIQNTRKLLTTAAIIMSTLLLTSSVVSTVLTPAAAFWPAITYTHGVNAGDLARGKAVVNVPLDTLDNPQQFYTLQLPASNEVRSQNFTVQAQTVGGPVTLNVTVTPSSPSTATVTVNKSGGEANGRALAYLAHRLLGEGFGTLYDISTILILWFAGASAMTGLLNIVPRYLPRYGMAPDWARATRPLVVIFTAICFLVTLLFRADVNAQGGAYATGVLALMTSAAIAVFLTELHRGHRVTSIFFGLVSVIFIYTISVTVLGQPQGLYIALLFIAAILAVSVASRVSRST
ncbi:MAG: APC family permease, partial [Deinococcota bacterium]